MKNIFLISLILLGLQSFVWIRCKEVKVIDAYSQDISGGARNTRPGTAYKITLIPKFDSKQVVIDQLWIEGVGLQVKVLKKGNNVSVPEFSKGDTVEVSSVFRQGDELVFKDSLKPSAEGTFIGYLNNGERKFCRIKKLRSQPSPRRK